jgi:hypothetical protein
VPHLVMLMLSFGFTNQKGVRAARAFGLQIWKSPHAMLMCRYRNKGKIKGDRGGLVKRTSIPRKTRTAEMPQTWVVLSRVLVLLTVLLILAMPWTEYFWHFDQFRRGGEDCELSLLAVATIFCLVVILLQHGKKSVAFILALRRRLSFVFQHDDPAAPGSFCGLIAASHVAPRPSPALGMYNLPIQI